jgi:hypothetical protein
MRRDLYSNIGTALAISPAVKSAAGDGITIDTKNFSSVAFVITTGAIASAGDFGVSVQESDASGSGFAAADAEFVDTNAPATLAADSTYKVGYRGNKRYVRLQLTKAGGTSIALGAVAVLGHPHVAPVA